VGLSGVFISTGQSNIQSIVFTPNNTVLIGDGANEITEYDGTTGDFIRVFASNIGSLQNGLAIGPNGNLFAGDTLTNSVHEYALDGSDIGVFASGGGLFFPAGVTFGGPNDDLFVVGADSQAILEYDGTTGAFIGTLVSNLSLPIGLRFGPNGNLWASDIVTNLIMEYDPVTDELLLSNDDGLLFPRGITFKPVSGPQDCLTMTVSALAGGQKATWDVSGATAGSKVAVVYGFKAGSTVVSGQLGFCATFGIKGVNQSKLVGSNVADQSGNASIVKKIPGNASGLTVLTQAAQQGTCPDECVSNLDTQVVQ